jgi:CubicO group peptidase (beta-lactamase class C family)
MGGARRSAAFLAATAMTGVLALLGCAASAGEADAGVADHGAAALVSNAEVDAIAERIFSERELQAAVGQVLEDGEVIAEFALGEAMTGVPATLDASWRNGAIAIAYLGVALLRLHEQGAIDADAPIARYLPELPEAEAITPRQLIMMTSGIPDYVPDPGFAEANAADPFRAWTPEELIAAGVSQPRLFAPGENWDYSHTGIVVLGRVLEQATGLPLADVLEEQVLRPAGLDRTFSEQTATIPEPFLHGFTAERGLYEDASFWNPSWTLAEGAVQTTTIGDAAASFDAIVGRGELLSEESYERLIGPELVGFGEELEGCRSCHTLDERFAYGTGVFLRGDYVAQTPLFGGYAASVVTLPAIRAQDGRSLTVAVAATLREAAVDEWSGAIPNRADELAIAIASALRPEQAPPPFARRG